MLMKNKSANMPAFLIPSDSDEDPAAAAPAPAAPPLVADTRPLSRAPSPFLSHEAYLASHRATLAADGAPVSSAAAAAVDDRMSLSPLSEGGELAELPEVSAAAPQHFPASAPGYWPGGHQGYYPGQQQYSDQMYQQYPHYGWGEHYTQYSQYSEEQARRDRAQQKYQVVPQKVPSEGS